MRQHISFAAVALIFATAFALITPPFEVPDEVGHYWRASSIAYGNVGRGSPVMPRGFRIIVWALWTVDRNRHLTAERMRLARGVQLESDVPVSLRTPAYYSPAAYLPQISAAFVTRVAAVRPFFGFYAGRLATLLVSIALILLASGIAPQLRDHFHGVALLPMSLFLFGSWSADAMTIVSAFLTTAFLLRAILRSSPTSYLEMVSLVSVSAWLALCKPSYIFITLLALTIPRDRFESFGRRFSFVGFLLVVVIGVAVLSICLTMTTAVAFPRSDIPVDARAQLRFIADDPIRFVGIVAHDLRANGVDYIKAMTGRFGLYDVRLPEGVTLVLLAVLAAVGLINGPSLPAAVRVLVLVIGAAIFIGIMGYLYVTSSIAGGTTIEGTQGRYILPILPLMLTAVRVPLRRAHISHTAIVIVAIAANTVAIFVLLHRYW
ncbi:MAG TPA: DUF2142 domain-containing protein [Thermoanaerobaculia bacterium]|jgi:uncharacterized membrane protein